MKKGAIYVFLTSIFIGYLGMSFIAHYKNKHGDRTTSYTYSSSESYIHHPVIGDFYTINNKSDTVWTYFKVVWVGENNTISIVNGKSPLKGSYDNNWVRNAINSNELFDDITVNLNLDSLNHNLSNEKGNQLIIHRLNIPLELSVLDKILSTPIGFLLSILLAFLLIMFATSTEIFVGKFASGFPRFGNMVFICYCFAYLFNNPVFFPSIGIAGLFSILTVVPTYLIFQKYKSRNSQRIHSNNFATIEFAKLLLIIILGVFFQVVALLITITVQETTGISHENLYIYFGDLVSKSFIYTNAILLWSCIAIGNVLNNIRHYLVNLQQKEKELAFTKQKELQSQAELDALQARVNPHFLYNSLNSIAGLAQEDPAKTEEMAIALSHFFKYSTNRQTENWSTIDTEIEMLETYLAIEKIRFGDRLQFKLACPDELLQEKIPRFLLQPIVENAIKYGYDKSTNSIDIQVVITKKKEKVLFQIFDKGLPFPDNMPSGYGLQSIRKKLALLFPDKHELAFINEPKKHVAIQITV